MKSLRFSNLRPLITLVIAVVFAGALTLPNCAPTQPNLHKIKAEAAKKYPVPPEPPRTIDTPSPERPIVPEPPPDATDEQIVQYERLRAAANATYIRKKNNWTAAKRRVEAQYSAWEKDKFWAIQKREDYMRMRTQPFLDWSERGICIGGVTVAALMAVTSLVLILIDPEFPLSKLNR